VQIDVKGTAAGGDRRASAVSQYVSAIPRSHPASNITSASVTSWRTRRPRDAPIASRMPDFLCRLDARASSMLATFAQAIQQPTPTTAATAVEAATSVPSAAG